MHSKQNLPWLKINDYLLDIGKARSPRDLYVSAINRIHILTPFDTAMLLILDERLAPVERVLLGMKQTHSDDYLEYYSKLDGGRFSYSTTNPEQIDWNHIGNCEFKTDYIRPQRVNASATFKFVGVDRWLKAAFVINRTNRCGFTAAEKEILKLIRRHLYNLHAILFCPGDQVEKNYNFNKLSEYMTKRESEIVDLLAKGLSPKQISKREFLSLHTVYNHLANIYKKNNVSNQRELLVKFMQSH